MDPKTISRTKHMNLYVPEIGDRIKLTADWTFDLHTEYRNKTLMEHFGITFNQREYVENRERINSVTIPSGTVLKVDRIYIRQGLQEWSSITFYAEGIGKGKGSFGKPKTARFWAKLVDCNKIEFELETAVADQKPPLVFSRLLDYKKMERKRTYVHPSEKGFNTDLPSKQIIDRICDIQASKHWDAKAVLHARITCTEVSVLEKEEKQSSRNMIGITTRSYTEKLWKITRDDIKYQLLDLQFNGHGQVLFLLNNQIPMKNTPDPRMKEIEDFRERNKGRFVSTSHKYPIKEMNEMVTLIRRRYRGFELDIRIRKGTAEIRIPAYRH